MQKKPKERLGSLVGKGIATTVGRVMEEKLKLETMGEEEDKQILFRRGIVSKPSGGRKR